MRNLQTSTQPSLIQKFLLHAGLFILYTAGGAALVALASLVGGFNIAVLPVFWQSLATLVVPMVIASLKQAQADLATAAAQEEAAAANAQLAKMKSQSQPAAAIIDNGSKAKRVTRKKPE